MRSEFVSAGKLRRERHQAYGSLRGVKDLIEGADVRRAKMFGRLHSAPGMREEWSFKMNANGLRMPGQWRLSNILCDTFDSTQSSVERCSDRGGEIRACAARSEEGADGIQRFGRRFHHVVPRGAVYV